MKYDFTEDPKLREALQKIITFDGINIEIVGCRIWVDGNTYEYKDALKNIGFKWAREKKKWHFHTETFRKKSNKKLSMVIFGAIMAARIWKQKEQRDCNQHLLKCKKLGVAD